MMMSEGEIVRDFRAAAKKGKQIGILADMNQCSREQIREILLRNGISESELPAKPGRKCAEETASKIEEEILPMEETAEPEAVHVEATEVRHEVPEAVKKACRDRIWGIVQEVAELEREKRELQVFLEENAV